MASVDIFLSNLLMASRIFISVHPSLFYLFDCCMYANDVLLFISMQIMYNNSLCKQQQFAYNTSRSPKWYSKNLFRVGRFTKLPPQLNRETLSEETQSRKLMLKRLNMSDVHLI